MTNGKVTMVEQVRSGILHGNWSPGARLRPSELARRFETSTTVVREALSSLVGDGLVVARPNYGFFVPELNLPELQDITELRCVTEALGARMAAERGNMDWEANLAAAHHRLMRTPRRQPEDPSYINTEWAVAHRDFHLALLSASECRPLIQLASNLADSTELYRRWAAPTESAAHRDVEAEHTALLEAALAHDGELLGDLLRAHYEATLHVVLDAGLVPEVVHQ